jgi:UDP-3-O-[3-hydroxymyristoyl] glucosamine N-acyltransferase
MAFSSASSKSRLQSSWKPFHGRWGSLIRPDLKYLFSNIVTSRGNAGDSLQVGNNTAINKNFTIGNDVVIGSDVIIEPYAIIGSRVLIGNAIVIP